MPCSKGMRQCKARCAHRDTVFNYRIARHAAELEREAICLGGKEEERDFGPILGFKDWLTGSKTIMEEEALQS